MSDTPKEVTAWKDVAFEAWKHHADVGGADKDRMIQVATWLLGISAGIVALAFTEAVDKNKVVEPVAAIILAILGLIMGLAAAAITVLYAGYANWNWAKADQIAKDQNWDLLDPAVSPYKKLKGGETRSFLVDWAMQGSEPKKPHKELAPVFKWFFVLSLLSIGVHAFILIWTFISR